MPVCSAFKSYACRLYDVLNLRRKKNKPRLVISAPYDFKKEDSICVLPGISQDELAMLREKAAASIIGSALITPYPDSPPLPPSVTLKNSRSIASFDDRLHPSQPGGHARSAADVASTLSLPAQLCCCRCRCCGDASDRTQRTQKTSRNHHNHHRRPVPDRPSTHAHHGDGDHADALATTLGTASAKSASFLTIHRNHSQAHLPQRGGGMPGGPMSFHPVVLASTEPYTPSGLSSPSSSSSSSSVLSSGCGRI